MSYQTPAAFRAALETRLNNRVFTERGTHLVPSELPLPPADWARRYRALVDEVGIEPEPQAGHTRVSKLLNPLLGDESAHGRWVPAAQTWRVA